MPRLDSRAVSQAAYSGKICPAALAASLALRVHSVCTSAGSVSDAHMVPDLLHGEEKEVWGDAGYQGQTEAIHAVAPEAQDTTSRRARYKGGVDEQQRRKN